MNWNAVLNASGTCAVTQREWTTNGQKYTGNDVKRFYDPEKSPVAQLPATRSQRPATDAASGQRPAQTSIPGTAVSGSAWSAGKF